MVRDEIFGTAGAVVMGRRMFDLGLEPWGDDVVAALPGFGCTLTGLQQRGLGPALYR
jgi:hypothetical protein